MISINKIDRVSPKLDKFNRESNHNISDFLETVSEKWKTSTQRSLSNPLTGRYPARRTGRLRSSVNPQGSDVRTVGDIIKGYLSVDTEYATIQEEGGRAGRYHSALIPSRAFARPALGRVWQKMLKNISDFIMRPFK